MTEIPTDVQKLFFSGKLLENNKTLGEYNINKDSSLFLQTRFQKGMKILVITEDSKILPLYVEH